MPGRRMSRSSKYSLPVEVPMFRIKGSASFCLAAVAATLSILCSGCGSSSSSSSSMNNSMSPAQAQAITDQMVQALTQALGNTFSSNSTVSKQARPSLSTVVRDIGQDTSGGCTPTSTGENCDWTISLTNDPCTGAQRRDHLRLGQCRRHSEHFRQWLGERRPHDNACELLRIQPDR